VGLDFVCGFAKDSVEFTVRWAKKFIRRGTLGDLGLRVRFFLIYLCCSPVT